MNNTHSSENMGREKEMAEGEVMGNTEKKKKGKDDEETGLFLLKVQSFPGRIEMLSQLP